MRIRSALVFAIACLLAMTVVLSSGSDRAGAAARAYDRNMVLSNAVFDATGTMTAAQIQTFLDRFPNSCLRSYRDRMPTGYSSYDGTGTAAEVIRASATLWGVNPQVLIATLEKEQSIVTGGGGCDSWRYWSAMGYNCPDGGGRYDYPALGITGTCVKREGDAGFSAQVNRGAWQLQFNRQRAEGNLDWNGSSSIVNYGFNTAGYRQAYAGAPSIYYDGWATIDGQPVYMTNGATATLYTYTPHLSANQAFSSLFTNWFGSTGSSGPTPTPTTVTPPPTTTRPPTTTAPPSPPPVTIRATDLAYIDSVHRVFMGRHATEGEKHLWGTYLAGGGSRSWFVSHVVSSVEYSRNLVADAYRKTLRRAPDQGGLASWTDLLVRSGRDDPMQAGLAGSPEYFQNQGRSDSLVFLNALYRDFLGRDIDAAGLSTWGSRLTDGSMSRTDVAYSILQSREYAQRVVGAAYARILGRWPDPSGWDHWSAAYLRSHRAGDVATALASSPEGFTHLSSLR